MSVLDSRRGKTTRALPLDAAKRSLQQLFRQLIAMTQSLPPLPEDANKVVSIRLFFNGNTPENYQPPGFRAASETESARFVTRLEDDFPHDQEIGSIKTGFHTCTLKITTIDEVHSDVQAKQNSCKIWNAEHHARTACSIADPDTQYVPSSFEIPPTYESQAVEDTTMSEVHVASHTEKSGMTSQPETTSLVSVNQSEAAHHDTIHRTGPSKAQVPCDVLCSGKSHPASPDEEFMNGLNRSCTQLKLETQPSRSPAAEVDSIRTCTADPKADVVNCDCGDHSEDGKMISCETCQNWFHLPCYVCS